MAQDAITSETYATLQVYYYVAYLLLSVIVTVWVGRSLSKNGRVFLVENFHGREELADSVNHLLLVGFYLINIGFVSLALRFGGRPAGVVESIEYLSTKIGLVIVVIGVMHFNNMRVLIKLRNSRLFNALQKQSTVEPGAAAVPNS
jgi:hypothetical protein